MQKYLEIILNWIWPQACLSCHNMLVEKRENFLCLDCFSQIDWIIGGQCSHCGKPNPMLNSEKLCYECKKTPYPWFKYHVFMLNDKIVKKILVNLKYFDAPYLIKYVIKLQENKIKQYLIPEYYDYIVPVPMSRPREKNRGYNQSVVIAKELAQILKAKICMNSIKRVNFLGSQTELPRQQRITNVKKCFKECRNSFEISDAKIFIPVTDG